MKTGWLGKQLKKNADEVAGWPEWMKRAANVQSGGRMTKTIKAWAACGKTHDPIVLWSISNTSCLVRKTISEISKTPWDAWYSNGYRVRRITITVED